MFVVGVCMVVTVSRTVMLYFKLLLLNSGVCLVVSMHRTVIVGVCALCFRMAAIGIMLVVFFRFIVQKMV